MSLIPTRLTLTLLACLAACVPAAAAADDLGPYPGPVPRHDAYDGQWTACHQNLSAEVLASDGEPPGGGLDLLFLGDSITEFWRGTSRCRPSCPECEGIPEVFARYFGEGRGWRAFAAGIPRDQTANLLWRLMNGEMPQINHPKVVVLLIGTNDLSAAYDPTDSETESNIRQTAPGVVSRLRWLLCLLRKNLPGSRIVAMGLLPRGTGKPPQPYDYSWPSVYARSQRFINAKLKSTARAQRGTYYRYCGAPFLTADGAAINSSLMPDVAHPTAEGFELLADCLDPLITRLMAQPDLPSGNSSSVLDAAHSTAEGFELTGDCLDPLIERLMAQPDLLAPSGSRCRA